MKCSELLIANPFTVPNWPDSELKSTILNFEPMVGIKPLIRLTLRVPARAAVVDVNWSNFVPAVVPPIEMSRLPPEFWV